MNVRPQQNQNQINGTKINLRACDLLRQVVQLCLCLEKEEKQEDRAAMPFSGGLYVHGTKPYLMLESRIPLHKPKSHVHTESASSQHTAGEIAQESLRSACAAQLRQVVPLAASPLLSADTSPAENRGWAGMQDCKDNRTHKSRVSEWLFKPPAACSWCKVQRRGKVGDGILPVRE